MRCRPAMLMLALAVALAPVAHSGPPPKPSVIPVSWELEFSYETPQMFTLTLPGEEKPRTFWYVLYELTNRTGKDQIFVPDFVLYTDTGQVLRAGEGVPAAIFGEIQKRHNDPLLVTLAAVTGRLLQGQDNARRSVAVWRDFDPKARGFDLFVGGLSGERAKLKLPAPVKGVVRDEAGKKVEVVRAELTLAKTMHLSYRLPGEAEARKRTRPELTRKQWVMR